MLTLRLVSVVVLMLTAVSMSALTMSAMSLLLVFVSVVSNAWLETLLSAINALPKETIKQEVQLSLLLINYLKTAANH